VKTGEGTQGLSGCLLHSLQRSAAPGRDRTSGDGEGAGSSNGKGINLTEDGIEFARELKEQVGRV
jgi:hypothetical protein